VGSLSDWFPRCSRKSNEASSPSKLERGDAEQDTATKRALEVSMSKVMRHNIPVDREIMIGEC
jgi:hypothetical protein